MTQNTEKTLTSLLSAPKRSQGHPFTAGYRYSQGEIPKVAFRRTRSYKIVRRPAS